MIRVTRAIEGLTVVALGCILLANTLGVLSWEVWASVFALWPLLIVALGLDIVGRGLGRDGIRVAASLVVFGGLVYAAVVTAAGGGVLPPERTPSGAVEEFAFREPASSSITRGVAVVRGGAGRVTVRGGDALASASGRSPFVPVFDVARDDGVARVEASLGSHPWVWTGRAPNAELEVALSRDVPWDLAIEAGAGQLVADFQDLRLSKVRIDTGVSESTVTFGEPDGAVPVEINAGVSSLTLRFPKMSSFTVAIEGARASFEGEGVTEPDSAEGAKTYRHGDPSARDRYDVALTAGVSSVKIELY
ncbi:MAG: hypothetical protein H5T75_00775 [Coriobacteriia bacterium]|nr:hypothetical protein [Coriobacteriia bacterium]